MFVQYMLCDEVGGGGVGVPTMAAFRLQFTRKSPPAKTQQVHDDGDKTNVRSRKRRDQLDLIGCGNRWGRASASQWAAFVKKPTELFRLALAKGPGGSHADTSCEEPCILGGS